MSEAIKTLAAGLFVLLICWVVPAAGIYLFAQAGSGLGALLSFGFAIGMGLITNKALQP